MAKPALPWLTKLCRLYEKHDSSVYGSTVAAHPAGLLISFELDRGWVHLLAHRKGVSSSYAETASFALSIYDAETMPGNGELVLRQFIHVLDRADNGDVRFDGR
ncbi:MAG: hypothetical protein VX944_17360 [Myxococcota bacterium]|nr:hypothetical protein [Myxococcota bacterium]MEC9391844.1 hypothetical protein [Myxococcota bacterium]